MKKLYTDEDYAQLAIQATKEGKKLVKIQEEEQEVEIDVPDYDDNGKPIMIEETDEDGVKISIPQTHKETIIDTTEKLELHDNPENFVRKFFNTSLGYVSRIVHKLDGTTEDFLNDTLPSLAVGVPIITYNADGSQNTNVLVTEQFITECRQQKLKDFYGEEPPQAEGT